MGQPPIQAALPKCLESFIVSGVNSDSEGLIREAYIQGLVKS
jgi:hypothetical protein